MNFAVCDQCAFASDMNLSLSSQSVCKSASRNRRVPMESLDSKHPKCPTDRVPNGTETRNLNLNLNLNIGDPLAFYQCFTHNLAAGLVPLILRR
jgi:hypothetical protein